MITCPTCGWQVDRDAPYCPNCGAKSPGAMDKMVAFAILAACLVLMPAILTVMLFGGQSFLEACATCFGSYWAWGGSLAFWAVVVAVGVQVLKRP